MICDTYLVFQYFNLHFNSVCGNINTIMYFYFFFNYDLTNSRYVTKKIKFVILQDLIFQ